MSTVVIDLSGAHARDSSAVTAKSASRGVEAEIIGLNPHSEQLHATLSGRLTGSSWSARGGVGPASAGY